MTCDAELFVMFEFVYLTWFYVQSQVFELSIAEWIDIELSEHIYLSVHTYYHAWHA